MKAVNLIPVEARKGGGAGRAGRSGGAVYIVLAALAVVVAVLGSNALASKSVKDEQTKLDTISRQADAAEAQARALAPYARFNTLRQKREQTVTSLVASRFDWAHAMHEVSRVLPTNAWLTQILGTVSPNVSIDGGISTAAGALRQSQQVPAIEVTGCTTSQNSVAKMISQMRLIDGVTRVSLAVAEKADQAQGADAAAGTNQSAAGAGGGSSDCRNGHQHFPKFDLVVFFRASAASAAVAPGQATASATTTSPAATTTTTPAAPTATTPAATTPTTTTPAGAAK